MHDFQELNGEANVFAIQEMSKNTSRSCDVDWPEEFAEVLGSTAMDGVACSGYSNFFSPADSNGAGFGNYILTNKTDADYLSWDLTLGCNSSRTAQAINFVEGDIDVWVINTHFQPCDVDGGDDGNGDFSENRCNLDSLLFYLDTLPSDSVAVVTGDFNIHKRANTDEGCIGNGFHPERFNYLVNELSKLGYWFELSGGVDHVFIRDPLFKLKGVSSSEGSAVPMLTVEAEGGGEDQFPYTNPAHQIIETDIQLRGPGISPAFVPHLVTL